MMRRVDILGKIRKFITTCDLVLVGLVLLLSVFGVVLIGSIAQNAGPATALQVRTAFNSQIVWLASGIFVLFAVSMVDYQLICRFYVVFAVLSIVMLTVVLIMPPLVEDFPRRWLYIPGRSSPTLQPSEFAKVFMLIFFAKFAENFQDSINRWWAIGIMLFTGAVPILLTVMQPSLAVSILLTALLLVMLFMSGIRYKYIIIGLLIITPLLLFFIYDIHREEHLIVDQIFQPFQLENRIKPFFGINVTPANIHQAEMSVWAIGTGGFWGRGLFGNAIPVPLAHNDFIFAVIGAEFGFWGSVLTIAVIFAIVIKCFIIGFRANSLAGRLLAAGIGAMIGIQAFVHIGVTTQLLPTTGIPLPFVSAGGSSMWINLAAIGIVLNIGMKPERKTMFLEK
ncbi:MAG: FtsW/RodA/SpoVE family cell cycle protein [Defluviitaleaceae bacterium]|nr:FtsW/RodA/SpoVE family cell cycle protein [Defluviitaleaceae bacterium]